MADTLTHSMHVEVISPDGPIFSEDNVDMVVARAEDGEFAVLKNHLPLAAALEMCPVRIIKGGKEQKVAVFGGFLEIKDNQVNIVAPLAELADTIVAVVALALAVQVRRCVGTLDIKALTSLKR